MRICVLWDKWCNIFLPLVSRRQRICTGLFWREVGLPHSRFDLCPVIHWDHDPTLPPHIPSTTPEPHRKTIATANQVGGSIATYTFQCIGCFSLRHLQVSVCKYALSYRYDYFLNFCHQTLIPQTMSQRTISRWRQNGLRHWTKSAAR